MRSWLLFSALFAAALGGCATAPPPPPEPPPPPARDRVGELRAAAAQTPSRVEVAPLQDPSVGFLINEADKAETAGDFSAALRHLEDALSIEPDNPHLLQRKAESLLAKGDYLAAEKWAMKSYDNGAQVGQWCVRNWLLIAQTRDALGDAATVAAATERAKGCPVLAKPRF